MNLTGRPSLFGAVMMVMFELCKFYINISNDIKMHKTWKEFKVTCKLSPFC